MRPLLARQGCQDQELRGPVVLAILHCFKVVINVNHSLQGYGVYRFANKYGANVDGYSPIYTPDTWSESGEHLVPPAGAGQAPGLNPIISVCLQASLTSLALRA